MRDRLMQVSQLMLLLYLVLMLAVVYWVYFGGETLAENAANPRVQRRFGEVQRGRIVSADGYELARRAAVGTSFARRYSVSSGLGPLIGYAHPRYGLSGIEKAWNRELTGTLTRQVLVQVYRKAAGLEPLGNDLHLTIDSRLQQVAEQALQHPGGLVVLHPYSGAIKALVSRPGFSPQRIEATWDELRADGQAPFVNRPFSGVYPPGSLFKLVVLAAALEHGVISYRDELVDGGVFQAGGYRVTNDGGRAHGELDAAQALAVSSNVVFAHLACRLGAERLCRYAASLGLESPSLMRLIRVPTASGRLPGLYSLGSAELAMLGLGQGRLLVTPLQMAVLTATIANGGTRVEPFVVEKVSDPAGRIVYTVRPRGHRVMDPGVARYLSYAMLQVVESGTGRSAALQGQRVAGKTGTAENPGGRPHAWFVGFAPYEDPVAVVAVVLENAGYGGVQAAPVAAKVLDAAVSILGRGESVEGRLASGL